MDAGAAGILGATIGGVTGVIGGLMTHRLQSKSDRKKWARDKQVEAYSSAIRYLVRVQNKRSLITAEGHTVLGQDAMKEWFDEISEAIAWLISLTIYCSEDERKGVANGSKRLNDAAAGFIQGGSAHVNIIQTAHDVCIEIAESARRDIGANVMQPKL
jgi:hypothetical protein